MSERPCPRGFSALGTKFVKISPRSEFSCSKIAFKRYCEPPEQSVSRLVFSHIELKEIIYYFRIHPRKFSVTHYKRAMVRQSERSVEGRRTTRSVETSPPPYTGSTMRALEVPEIDPN